MRLVLTAVSLVVFALLTPLSFADTVDDFVLNDGSYTISFSLPAHPIADYSYGYGNFEVYEVPIEVDNTAFEASVIGFYLKSASGGFYLHYGPDEFPFEYRPSFSGPSLFTVSPSGEYTFLTDTFSLVDDVDGGTIATLTISPEGVPSSVPEPSSVVFLGTGLVAGFGVVRRSLLR